MYCILVDINYNFDIQAKETKSTLEQVGFALKEKINLDFDNVEPDFKLTYNQIWVNSNIV